MSEQAQELASQVGAQQQLDMMLAQRVATQGLGGPPLSRAFSPDLATVIRAAGLDPDGPLKPMAPAWWWNVEACRREDAEVDRKAARDTALVRALRFC